MAVMEAVCDEQGFVLGPRVAEFEAAIARYVGCRHGIGCASGSDALLLALMALGVKSGDEVITVPLPFLRPREPFRDSAPSQCSSTLTRILLISIPIKSNAQSPHVPKR